MIGDISFTIYLAHVLIIRPFDKIARIFKIDTSFVMLLMIPICLFFVVIICKYIDLINKKICIYLNRINMVG